MRNVDVLALCPIATGIKGFKVSDPKYKGVQHETEASKLSCKLSCHKTDAGPLANELRLWTGIVVVDQTGLTGDYDYSLTWNMAADPYPSYKGLNQDLRDQLGLELVPTNMPVKMLVVKKAQ